MNYFLLFTFLFLSQVGLAQKENPVYYKVVEYTKNNSSVSETTYYLSLHELKRLPAQKKLMEMRIDVIEETNGKDTSYSNIKIEEMSNYMNNSSKLMHLSMNHLPIQFTLDKNGYVIDSVEFTRVFSKLMKDTGTEKHLSALYSDKNMHRKYTMLLNEIYFSQLTDLDKKTLKRPSFLHKKFKYQIRNRSRKNWDVYVQDISDSSIFIRVSYDPRSLAVLKSESQFHSDQAIGDQTISFKRNVQVSKEPTGKTSNLPRSYYQMVLKSNPWSTYIKQGTHVDTARFAEFVNQYGNAFKNDHHYVNYTLKIRQSLDNGDDYKRALASTPSKIIKNTYHIINKVRNSTLSSDDFLETVSLLNDDYLYDYLQTGLSQGVLQNQEEALLNMRKINTLLTEREKEAITPMVIWSALLDSKDNTAIQKSIDELHELSDQQWNSGNVGRYVILLEKKLIENGSNDRSGLVKTLERLQVLAEDTTSNKMRISEAQLAYANFLMYESLNRDQPEKARPFLKAAADRSSKTRDDYDNLSYYDQYFLKSKMNYTEDYLHALNENGQPEELLNEYVKEYLIAPGNNYAMLSQFYRAHYDEAEFANFLKSEVFTQLQDGAKFTLRDIQGNDISLDQYRGKWVFIDFWGTWCGPCVAEMPDFNTYYQETASTNKDRVQYLTIACYDDEKTVKDFMVKNKYDFPVLLSDGKIQQDYQVTGYPYKVIITPAGKLIPLDFGFNWKDLLGDLVAL